MFPLIGENMQMGKNSVKTNQRTYSWFANESYFPLRHNYNGNKITGKLWQMINTKKLDERIPGSKINTGVGRKGKN